MTDDSYKLANDRELLEMRRGAAEDLAEYRDNLAAIDAEMRQRGLEHTPTDDEREAHRRVIDLWFANWRSIGKVSPALEVAIDSLEGMVSDALDAGFRRSEVPEASVERDRAEPAQPQKSGPAPGRDTPGIAARGNAPFANPTTKTGAAAETSQISFAETQDDETPVFTELRRTFEWTCPECGSDHYDVGEVDGQILTCEGCSKAVLVRWPGLSGEGLVAEEPEWEYLPALPVGSPPKLKRTKAVPAGPWVPVKQEGAK